MQGHGIKENAIHIEKDGLRVKDGKSVFLQILLFVFVIHTAYFLFGEDGCSSHRLPKTTMACAGKTPAQDIRTD